MCILSFSASPQQVFPVHLLCAGHTSCEVTDRAQYRAGGKAVTEAETESSWLNRHTEEVEGREREGFTESRGRSLQAELGWEEKGVPGRGRQGQETQGLESGYSGWQEQGKALHTSAFYQSGQ